MSLTVGAPTVLGSGLGQQIVGDNYAGDAIVGLNLMEDLQIRSNLAAHALTKFTEPSNWLGNGLRHNEDERSGRDIW